MGRINTFYLSILCLFLLGSCSNYNKENYDETPSVPTLKDGKYELVVADSISFKLDSLSTDEPFFIESVRWKAKNHLGIVNRYINAIELYDFDTKQLAHRTIYQIDGPSGIGKLEAFYWVNDDSIFIHSSFKNQMAWVDLDGNLVAKPNYGGDREAGTLLTGSTKSKILRHKNSFFIRKGLKNWYVGTMKDYYRKVPQKITLKYNFESDSYSALNIDFPKVYKEQKGVLLPTGANHYTTIDRKGNLVYSFPLDHFIWIMNADSAQFHLNTNAISQYANNPLIELYEGEILDLERLRAKSRISSFYKGIAYDKYRDVLYRFNEIALEEPINPKKNRLYTEENKPFSIVILNSDYQVIGETLFPKNTYDLNTFFIGEEGLYISANNPFNKNREEDLLTFKLFTLGSISP